MNQTEDDRYRFALEIEDSLQDSELYFNEDLVERAVMNLLIMQFDIMRTDARLKCGCIRIVKIMSF